MKKLHVSLFLLLAVLNSCNKETAISPSKGNATFSLSPQPRNDGRIAQTTTPAFALLSIEDVNGKTVVENKKLSLVSFGQGYVSENLELSEGTYKLVQFLVLNTNDTAIYAAPLAGSELAKNVTNPLPISFTITKNANTQVAPEVLAVTPTDVPESFGYVSFGFKILQTSMIQIPLPNKMIDKVTMILGQDQGIDTVEFFSPNTSLVFNDDKLLGKKWPATIIIWYHQGSCFQRISRFKGEIDLATKSSVSLPPVTDNSWEACFYSEHIYGGKKLSIYRSISQTDMKIEIDFPISLTPFYGFADQGYFDNKWVQVCSMPYVEFANQLIPPPPSPTYIKWKFDCDSSSLGILDNLISLDLPVYGHHEDYFAWTKTGKPLCTNYSGGRIASNNRHKH